jgi:PTS system N-acetylglucosamine-specific IIC component
VFAVIYFVSSYYTIKLFKLNIFEEDNHQNDNYKNDNVDNTLTVDKKEEAQAFIDALGGKENIVDTDACITRLRMTVKDSTQLKDEDFTALGAKGVIRPSKESIQIVLGTKAEGVAEQIKAYL